MPPKAKNFVSDIKPWKTEWRVHVKAVHSWKQQSKFGGESLEMILADETGAKIHASCKHGFLAKVQRDLPINEWRVIDTFNVSPARGHYRTTAHTYRIAITKDTSIASSDVKIETPFLSLAPFTSINNGDLDPDFLIDVFGQVVDIGDMLTVQVSGEERQKCEFYLRDTSGHTIQCCLWGRFAEQFQESCQEADKQIILCLIRFAKITSYRGELQVTNSFDASDVKINPSIPESDEYMKLYHHRKRLKRPGLILTAEEKQQFALVEIEKLMKRNGSSLSLYESMPKIQSHSSRMENVLIFDERNYNLEELRAAHDRDILRMTDEQKKIYDEIIGAVDAERGGMFFVYGFGGTGKTFLWRILSAAIRCKGDIVLNTASSGIASLLLQGGRTAHSRFGIPINPDEFTTCNIVHGTDKANLIKEASLIIWDEAPMMSKYCFESLDRSLKDLMGNHRNKPFGGKVVVFGGDFRQVLPVITGAGRAEIVLAAMNSSYLWEHCKVLKLTKNMRLSSNNLTDEEANDLKELSNWILDVGDGKIEEPNDGEVLIDIPDEFLIIDPKDPIETISHAIYGSSDSLRELKDPIFFQERAILCPTNEDVNMINDHMLSKLDGEERIYISSDSIDPSDLTSANNQALSTDFLNSIKVSGLPNHSLRLKIGCPVMLLRNINSTGGLMNGTRLQITEMMDFMVGARILTGEKVGDIVYIPRLLIHPSDKKLPFKMRRRQLPLAVAFAITINKSQGQSLSQVGLFLPRPVFSHGQLYVAISRVTSKKGLKILIVDKDGKPQRKTKNVVFKEVFNNLENEDQD